MTNQNLNMKKLLLTTFLSFGLSLGVQAEVVELDKLIVSTPSYQPEFTEFKPELGTYEFSVSWAGIPAATVLVDVDKEGVNYKLSTNVKTNSAISIFYKLKYHAYGLLSGVDYRPIQTTIDSYENSRHKVANISFESPDRVVSNYTDTNRADIDYDFDPNNMMLEPFSAAFFARSLDWSPGTTRYFDTFNGKSRYLISFTSKEMVKMRVNGVQKDVWVIQPKVKKISSNEESKKLRQANIYVTADAKREILRISSEVFVGSVNTELKSFTPRNETGVTVASNQIDYKF